MHERQKLAAFPLGRAEKVAVLKFAALHAIRFCQNPCGPAGDWRRFWFCPMKKSHLLFPVLFFNRPLWKNAPFDFYGIDCQRMEPVLLRDRSASSASAEMPPCMLQTFLRFCPAGRQFIPKNRWVILF
ncbi:hypothetical protein [Ethanoligenens harbinense]|uniref:hypothetical protein n=1 Tax=Ethanoligenens harbinense TaxID=253239 RepID=UPI00131E1C1C|nr:hypothetical protein [Ethanoligenens harbinense]